MNDDETSASEGPSSQQPLEQPDRQAQPVDAEQPPYLAFPVVGVGASAGGLEAFTEFLSAMRPDSGMAFVLIQHLPPDRDSMMAEILSRRTAMTVRQVEDGMPVEPNHVYVIRPGHVLTIQEGKLRLGPVLGASRVANRPVDDFFKSLAEEQRERAVCIIMSGMGSNGTAGAQALKAVGGLCIAQDPESAQHPSMPRHLIDAGYADYVLRPTDIPDVLMTYASSPYASGGREADPRGILEREQQHLREVLAVLRSRTRQDFSGYKKPTVLRRVQRRMGLTRIAKLAEYARFLRQTPGEVTGLADDLLIHVTGFFRDPDAWETLRTRVIAPLVAAREYGAPIRAWVTACSSGEEAYSLVILLVEEAEKIGKHLDIKVFATDLAERALANARAGIYPGGIESEIVPERLARFFTRDGEIYRVRQEVRDRVVFAPQNVLQDPPFSRLDIATCRNLLIYLEPEVQLRVLTLLHFGLREGGTLFLGTSETIASAEEMFEAIDKKARIFRRIGRTRHGAIEFPLARGLQVHDLVISGRDRPRQKEPVRLPVAQATQQILLDHHTPPAVTIDRDHRVLYFHGDTRPFLQQPTGEPTRDLLHLARDGIRGAIRVALHRAAAENETVTALEGWIETEPGRRARVSVTASPVPTMMPDDAQTTPEHFVVSFTRRDDIPAASASNSGEHSSDEFRRLRSELQGTIEELQTSNEELKASNEEVMSINEEIQSANEELETSKEEMQSLNEELNTVNAQLRAKMEEHQSTSSDLTSLLASTDIAVLFLDRALCIRRYTPAIRDLVDMIDGDVGRPLTALAKKFDDPTLESDALAVLERLVPTEREVAGADGRHYLRRVTAYRTTDNRIDGVVITFVDITPRKQAEDALRASREELAEEAASLTRLHEASNRLWQSAELNAGLQEVLDAALAMLGADMGNVQLLNPATGSLEIAAQRGFQKDFLEFFRDVSADDNSACARSLRTGNRVVIEDVEKDAEFAPLRPVAAKAGYRAVQSTPLIAHNGELLGVLSTHFREPQVPSDRNLKRLDLDVRQAVAFIERHHIDAALRISEERLRWALLAARMGTWTLDLETGTQTRDANLNRLLGLDPVETSTPFADFFRHIHSSDHAQVQASFDAAASGRQWLSVEFRVIWPDGSIHWLRDQGDAIVTEQGTLMAGACADVTERREAQEAVRAGEERLRHILESATDYAVLTMDQYRVVTSWSPGAVATFGFTEDEIIGRPSDVLFTPEDRATGEPVKEVETAQRNGRAADERWHMRKDGTRFYASGVLTPLRNGGFVKVARDLTDRKRIEDELRDARTRLETRVAERTAELKAALDALEAEMARRAHLTQQLATIQDDERRRIARDLHDTVGQTLTALSLAVAAVTDSGKLQSPAADRLQLVHRLAETLGREIHEVAMQLRPAALDDIGLERSLQTLTDEWFRQTGVPIEMSAKIGSTPFPMQVKTALYRVVQEALTNVAKHAAASRVSVVLGRSENEAVLVVEDDGIGFDPDSTQAPTAGRRGGMGLAIMRERVQLLNGVLEIESAPGGGTTVIARIPLSSPAVSG
jgi:two-component system CheB/CheR fusion protein